MEKEWDIGFSAIEFLSIKNLSSVFHHTHAAVISPCKHKKAGYKQIMSIKALKVVAEWHMDMSKSEDRDKRCR